MATILTICPVTGQPIDTGIETDEASFARLPAFLAQVYCPHCRSEHDWTKEAAWVTDAGKQAP
jgi:hypothetical protein